MVVIMRYWWTAGPLIRPCNSPYGCIVCNRRLYYSSICAIQCTLLTVLLAEVSPGSRCFFSNSSARRVNICKSNYQGVTTRYYNRQHVYDSHISNIIVLLGTCFHEYCFISPSKLIDNNYYHVRNNGKWNIVQFKALLKICKQTDM